MSEEVHNHNDYLDDDNLERIANFIKCNELNSYLFKNEKLDIDEVQEKSTNNAK